MNIVVAAGAVVTHVCSLRMHALVITNALVGKLL